MLTAKTIELLDATFKAPTSDWEIQGDMVAIYAGDEEGVCEAEALNDYVERHGELDWSMMCSEIISD